MKNRDQLVDDLRMGAPITADFIKNTDDAPELG